MVIHGGVDGFSRIPVFLKCCDNNKAESVLAVFKEAVSTYGLPRMVRTDRGGENVLMCDYMLQHPERGPGHFITGRSVHNQRIERMWGDVYPGVVQPVSVQLHQLEEDGVLDIESDIDIFCVHLVFVPRINAGLQRFIEAWICHRLSTTGKSPLQLWLTGEQCGSPPITQEANIGPQVTTEAYALREIPSTPVPIGLGTVDLGDLQALAKVGMDTEVDGGRSSYLTVKQCLVDL
jgi:hypothetical protein